MDYRTFLSQKVQNVKPMGFDVDPGEINQQLFKFQRDSVRWGLRLGRAALFEECGMGKSAQYLEWARLIVNRTRGNVLILEPLAVAAQTVREGQKFGVDVKYAKCQEALQLFRYNSDIGNENIVVTNYERLHLFEPSSFVAVVLDESSILKNLGGKTFWQLVRAFENTPYKLACTATPAPNDFVEFSNHSTFLGIMHFKEVLARWFTGDSKLARSAILKKHAKADWWRWLTSWALCLSKPGDLGNEYHMDGYDLPPLNMIEHRLASSQETIERSWQQGLLLPDTNPNSTTLHKVKRESLHDRVAKAKELVDALPADAPCVLWCDTNYEADALIDALPEAVEVRGSHTLDEKESRLNAFTEGRERLLITKPEIAGFGLNWQHCADMIFCGVSFSFEKTYQAIHRTWRYGQTKPVNSHIIYAESEGNVMDTLKRKQRAFAEMQAEMNAAMREHGLFRDGKRLSLASSIGHTPMQVPSWLVSKELF